MNFLVTETALLYLSLLKDSGWNLHGGQRFINFYFRIWTLNAAVLILGGHHRKTSWFGLSLIYFFVPRTVRSYPELFQYSLSAKLCFALQNVVLLNGYKSRKCRSPHLNDFSLKRDCSLKFRKYFKRKKSIKFTSEIVQRYIIKRFKKPEYKYSNRFCPDNVSGEVMCLV